MNNCHVVLDHWRPLNVFSPVTEEHGLKKSTRERRQPRRRPLYMRVPPWRQCGRSFDKVLLWFDPWFDHRVAHRVLGVDRHRGKYWKTHTWPLAERDLGHVRSLRDERFLDLASFPIRVGLIPRYPDPSSELLGGSLMKRKWQISDISQFHLLPLWNTNAEKSDLNFSCGKKNSPSFPVARTRCRSVAVTPLLFCSCGCFKPRQTGSKLLLRRALPFKKNPAGFRINYKCLSEVFLCSYLSLHKTLSQLFL